MSMQDMQEMLKRLEKAVQVLEDEKLKEIAFERLLEAQLRGEAEPQEQLQPKQPSKRKGKQGKGHRRGTTLSRVPGLDLAGDDSRPSLKKFVEEKAPSNQLEMNTVFVYYLKTILGRDTVTVNDVYTCYRDVKAAQPSDLRNRLCETASREGWLITKNMKDIQITSKGKNLVEDELPKKKR